MYILQTRYTSCVYKWKQSEHSLCFHCQRKKSTEINETNSRNTRVPTSTWNKLNVAARSNEDRNESNQPENWGGGGIKINIYHK